MISFMKVMSLLRCNMAFGRLVKLVMNCFKDVFAFLLFFMAWVFIFAKLFQITGAEIDEEEYPRVPLLSYYLFTFRATLGETTPPTYYFWEEMIKLEKEDERGASFPTFMIYVIWIVWFLNLFMNTVILLNFLIAIIGQSFETVISNRLTYQY